MSNKGYALARAELVRVLTAHTGITTNDGEADGTTLVDSTLIGRNDFITGKNILIESGDAQDEDKPAESFDTDNGKITVKVGFKSQIKAGIIYRIVNISSVELDIANILARVGTSADPPGTSTIFAWLASLLFTYGQIRGLAAYGQVTQVDDDTHFRVAGLVGFGDAYFANNYWVYVVRDAGGAKTPPHGEMKPCSEYTSTTGGFTHTAFSAPLAVDDEVLLIHNRIAEILAIKAKTDLIPADIVTQLDTNIPAVKAQTDKLAGAAPVTDSTSAAWQTGEANVVSIGAANVKNKLHSLWLSIHNLVGTTITVRIYHPVKGTERKVYDQPFDATSDPPGLWIVNGTLGIHGVLRVTLQSNNAADNNKAVDYDYMLEVM